MNVRLFACLLMLSIIMIPLSAKAVDSTSYDPTAVVVKASSTGGVPIGTIIAWPVATNPDDWSKWLECNGQSITRAAYPDLYALVGSKLPDLRGLFLRGRGGNSAVLGTVQNDNAYISSDIKGKIQFYSYNYYRAMGGEVGVGPSVYNGGYSVPDPSSIPAFDFFSLEIEGNSNIKETRPKNMAVRYLIRAKR